MPGKVAQLNFSVFFAETETETEAEAEAETETETEAETETETETETEADATSGTKGLSRRSFRLIPSTYLISLCADTEQISFQ